MSIPKIQRSAKFIVKYSSKDGKTYGVIAAGFFTDEQQAINKSRKELARTNPNAAEFNFSATKE